MSGIFAITAASQRVQLDEQRRAEVAFTVSNRSGCAMRARLLIRPQDGTATAWLALEGELERELAVDGTEQICVQVAIPADAPAGSYAFRLDVVGVANPDEHVSAGQWVGLVVPPAQPPRRGGFPWWLLLVAAGLAALVGLGLGLGLHHWLPVLIGVVLGLALAMLGLVMRARRAATVRAASAVLAAPATPPAPVPVAAAPSAAAAQIPPPPPAPAPVAEVAAPAPVPAPAPAPAPEMLMPRLIGWRYEEALRALQVLGMQLGAVEEQTSASPPGTVLDHRPSEGQRITRGETVRLVVAAPAAPAGGGP